MNSNTYNILYNSYYFLLKPIIILIIGIIIFKLWDWQFILCFIPSNNLTINLTINSIFLSYILYLIEEKINTNSSYIFVQMDKDKNNVNSINHQMKNISLNINDDKTTIVYVFIYVKGKINSHNNKLTIDSIAGIKGSTNDSENNVSINGNDTINMLSSLSFLLESKNMKEIIIHLSYKKEHNIKLCLLINNTLQIRSYLGTFDDMYYFNEYGENCVDFLPILLVYCELLPVLIKWFKKNIDIRDVNIKYLYHKFCKKIIDDINYKINKRIEEIK